MQWQNWFYMLLLFCCIRAHLLSPDEEGRGGPVDRAFNFGLEGPGPIQIISLTIPKRGSQPLCGGLRLRLHVSGSSLGMSPKPSEIAHNQLTNQPA